jgi:hypothetical protein
VTQISLSTEHSILSGPTVCISINSEVVRVGFDFMSPINRLWRNPAAFVEIGNSGSNEYSPIELTTEWVGFSKVLSFTPHMRKPQDGRDVAGFIGASKGSELFVDRVLSLSLSDESEMEIKEILHVETVASLTILQSVSEMSMWNFLGSIEFRQRSGIRMLGFDPSSQKIQVPHRDLVALLAAEDGEIRFDDFSRVHVKCDSFTSEVTVHALSGGTTIALPVRIQTEQSEGEWCISNLVSSTESDGIILGRGILDSVSSVVLDYRSGIVGIVQRTSPVRRLPAPSRAFVPIFSAPLVGLDEVRFSVNRDVQNTPWTELFVFRGEGPSRDCWTFDRLVPDPSLTEARRTLLPGVFTDMVLEIDSSDQLVFRMIGDGVFRFVNGVMVESWHSIDVCRIRRDDYNLVDLPPISEIPDSGSMDCAICLSRIERSFQGIHGCPHGFHRDCLLTWLYATGQTCPVCRTVVSRVVVPTTTTPLPSALDCVIC